MTKSCFLLFICFVVVSCAPTLGYVGSTYNPTERVDVYVDESSIPVQYTVFGKGYVRSYRDPRPEMVQSKAIAKAKQKGADAILIKDYFLPAPGVSTTYKRDSSGKGSVSIGNTVVPQSSEFVVFFLKYK